MKYLFILIALLTITTSCELRSTNFDPDNQLLSEDELTQIAVLDNYQPERLTAIEYESRNYEEFVQTEFTYRQNAAGKWIIEGSIKNFASKAHFKDAQLSITYYDETNQLIGTDSYTVNDNFSPGDEVGYYFKSDKYTDATSVGIKINQLRAVR